MRILLQWLVDNAWILYVVCALGIVWYLIRALVALRERRLSMFTLERETATSRLVQAFLMILVFIGIGGLIYASAYYVLPRMPSDIASGPSPTPTLAVGLETPTPGSVPSPTPAAMVPAATPDAGSGPQPTPPAPAITEPPSAPPTDSPPGDPAEPSPTEPPPEAPTETPELQITTEPGAAVAAEVRVQFGDFAELLGFAIPSADVTSASSIPLTLYWQALAGRSPVDYRVFTHLLSEDGQLLAQHDSPPANGSRPTSTWSPGESIVDSHPMGFQDLTYTGPARILVGLYDPDTGRVVTNAGADHVVLPVAINVRAE
jgi:hypothetical protein